MEVKQSHAVQLNRGGAGRVIMHLCDRLSMAVDKCDKEVYVEKEESFALSFSLF